MGAQVNYWAVLVSALLFYGIGAIWYSPYLFGSSWMAESALSKEKLSSMGKGHTATVFASTFLLSLLMAYITAHLVYFSGSNNIGSGLLMGTMLWLGYVVSTLGINYLYEDKSFKFFLINAGYFFTGLLAMGVILSVWN